MELTVDEMAETIVKACTGGTSFVELQQAVGPESRGDFIIQIRPNLLLWANVSERFAQAFTRLLDERRIRPTPTSALVYMFDGVFPQLPIAKRLRAYKKPHWLPVVFKAEKT